MLSLRNLFSNKNATRLCVHALLFIILFLLLFNSSHAFKMSIHDNATQQELEKYEFDEESADTVADANFYTDLREMLTEAAHADNNQLPAASARLRGKLNSIPRLLAACEPSQALKELGSALHTVQDIWSHTNAIDVGLSIDILNMQRVDHDTEQSEGYCEDEGRLFPENTLISGYFALATNQCVGQPEGVCCHLYVNKDNERQFNGQNHPPALNAARTETIKYLNSVEGKIRSLYPGDRGNYLVKMLKERQKNFYFVIDDTRSMAFDLLVFRGILNALLDRIVDLDEAPTLGFITFKDSISVKGSFCDVEKVRDIIDGLKAEGGDDCPEYSNKAILAALSRFPYRDTDTELKGGMVLMLTDASPKNPNLGPMIANAARAKGVKVVSIITSDCVPEDSIYFPRQPELKLASDMATSTNLTPGTRDQLHKDPLTSKSIRTQMRAIGEQTGGSMYWISRHNIDQILPAIFEQGDPKNATLLRSRFYLQTGDQRVLEFPVDDTVTSQIRILALTTKRVTLPDFSIVRPDGQVVSDSDPDVVRQKYYSKDEYLINQPMPGKWVLRFDGHDSMYTVQVFGPASYRPTMLRFNDTVTQIPNEHIEVIPMQAMPVAGSMVEMDVRMTNKPVVTEIVLRSLTGDVLHTLTPATNDNRYFRSTYKIPDEPFYVDVVGKTTAGIQFRRQIDTPVIPQKVGLMVTPRYPSGAPGTRVNLQVEVENTSGTSGIFDVTASTLLEWPVSAPGWVEINANETVTIPVSIDIPQDVALDVVDNFFVEVKSQATIAHRNSAVLPISIGNDNQPPVCTEAVVTPSELWPPNHKLQNISFDGIVDPDGDSVTITYQSITQDEPTLGLGDGDTAPDASISEQKVALRRERNGAGDGRVYNITFEASDGKGGRCSSSVNVSVPRDATRPAIDSGQQYDSLGG